MQTKQIKIQIPEPCHEDWNKMTPKDKGAFCSSCEKVVVDFTKMSDREIVNFIEQNKGKKTCGKFNSFQVDRKLVASTPSPNYWMRLRQFVVSLFLGLSFPAFLKAHHLPKTSSPVKITDDAEINVGSVKGVVKGPQGELISSAYVRVYQEGKITQLYALTDEQGIFTIKIPENSPRNSLELRVNAQGFANGTADLDGKEFIDIQLQYQKMLGKMAFHPIEDAELIIDEEIEPLQTLKGEIQAESTSKEELVGQALIQETEYIDIMGDIDVSSNETPISNVINGVLLDENGETLPFANIRIQGTERGVITGVDGEFSLDLLEEDRGLESLTLEVSFLGYKTKTEVINLSNVSSDAIMIHMDNAHMELMGLIIPMPVENFENPSGFDENYQEPEWKEQGFESRREYMHWKKDN